MLSNLICLIDITIIKLSLILNIETSTKNCSVALHDGIKLIACKSFLSENYSHSELLTIFIEDVMNKSKFSLNDLHAISVSKGPGSYTGLRIGVATAKGLSYSLSIPMISISTLRSMSHHISDLKPNYDLYCPMIDARRMEVFSAFYDSQNNMIREVRADIIDQYSYKKHLNKKVLFFGDGAEKCKKIINSDNAFFLDNIYPSADYMTELSLQKYHKNKFEDIAYFEPFYLKEFVSGR